MAFKKKTEEPAVELQEQSTDIKVTLVNPSYSSVISNGCIIEFIDGKATVSMDIADKLREQGLIV